VIGSLPAESSFPLIIPAYFKRMVYAFMAISGAVMLI
jgi:hypothetical protein